jgi:hypothetical protein
VWPPKGYKRILSWDFKLFNSTQGLDVANSENYQQATNSAIIQTMSFFSIVTTSAANDVIQFYARSSSAAVTQTLNKTGSKLIYVRLA